jgi:hypothetical protein
VDGASPCSLHGDRGLIVTSIFVLCFCLTLLMFDLSIGQARHHFAKVNFYPLLWYNLEQQCLVSAPPFSLFWVLFWFQSIETLLCRVTTWRRLLRSRG